MKEKKDVKFIIYQALYILVICIIAIKGADINLEEVELKKLNSPGYAYIDTTDKVQIKREELAHLINLDSTKYMIISREDYNSDPEKYRPISFASITNPVIQSQDKFTTNNPDPDITKDIDEKIPITEYASKLNLTQYTIQSISNPFNKEMVFAGTVIPVKTAMKIQLGGESTQSMKVGGQTASVSIKPNAKPKIEIQRIASMDEDTRVSTLQSTTGFRVRIIDDFPEQLEVKFSPGIIAKPRGDYTWDIILSSFSSKPIFENYAENRDKPYRFGFNVTVTDKLAGHKVTGQQEFVFGEW